MLISFYYSRKMEGSAVKWRGWLFHGKQQIFYFIILFIFCEGVVIN